MSTENMEAPEIYSGKVGVEIVPDMRKLRSFAKDFIALVDSYWPEETGSPLATQSRQTGNCDSPTPAGELCPSSDTARKPTPDSPSEHQST